MKPKDSRKLFCRKSILVGCILIFPGCENKILDLLSVEPVSSAPKPNVAKFQGIATANARSRQISRKSAHKEPTVKTSNGPSSGNPMLLIPNRITVQQKLSKEDLYNLKAESFYAKGLRSRSIEIWESILGSSPEHLPSTINLASAYFNERRYIEAETMYQRLIQMDALPWKFPEARFFGPMAHFKQYGKLESSHGILLSQYLNQDSPVYRNYAATLRSIAVDTIATVEVGEYDVKTRFMTDPRYDRKIVHFWAEWCIPCLNELSALFEFRRQYPDISYLIVSIDAQHDKSRTDNRLNEIFSPHKSSKSENIRFIFDPGKRLWETFIPHTDQKLITVPRTLFYVGSQQTRYIPQQLDWKSLNPEHFWIKTKRDSVSKKYWQIDKK